MNRIAKRTNETEIKKVSSDISLEVPQVSLLSFALVQRLLRENGPPEGIWAKFSKIPKFPLQFFCEIKLETENNDNIVSHHSCIRVVTCVGV